jgi:hypothetical protein
MMHNIGFNPRVLPCRSRVDSTAGAMFLPCRSRVDSTAGAMFLSCTSRVDSTAGAMFLPCRNRVRICRAIPDDIQARIVEANARDRRIVQQEQIKALKSWCDPKYADAIETLQNKWEIIDELDYVRVMYGDPPLSSESRILLRQKITHIMNKYIRLSDQEVALLVSILEYYKCL